MTTTQKSTTRLPKPLYAMVGVGEYAYQRLQRLPARVEALRTEVPARVSTLVAGARDVYGDLVAHGEKLVDQARTRRPQAAATAAAIATAPAKAARAARAATKAGGRSASRPGVAAKKTAPPRA